MAAWKKLLASMVADRWPTSYTYAQAGTVLKRLGFDPPELTGGSHRKWRRVVHDAQAPSGKRTVYIGLVDKGHGTMPPVYVREMVQILRENHLLP